MTAASVQPDLFGEWDAEQDRRAARAELAPRWSAWLHSEPRPFPYDTQGGGREGEMCDDWWQCPGCGEVELGSYALWINHGFHPEYVGHLPWAWEDHGGCHRTIRQARAIGEPGTEPRAES